MPPVLGLSTYYYELQTGFSDKDTNVKIEFSMQHLITNCFQHCWVIGFLKHRSLCSELYSLTVIAKNKSPDSEGLLCSVNCSLFLPLLSLLLSYPGFYQNFCISLQGWVQWMDHPLLNFIVFICLCHHPRVVLLAFFT